MSISARALRALTHERHRGWSPGAAARAVTEHQEPTHAPGFDRLPVRMRQPPKRTNPIDSNLTFTRTGTLCIVLFERHNMRASPSKLEQAQADHTHLQRGWLRCQSFEGHGRSEVAMHRVQ